MKTTDFQRSDTNQGALLNTNNKALERYKASKKRFAEINKIEQLENRMERLENLLIQIVEKLDDSSRITS